MGKIGFMLLGGAITIVGLGVFTLITIFVSWIQEKIIMHTINKENNLNRQLEKAKEIIRDFLSVAIDYIDKEDKNYSLITEAEQFLNSEVEK